MDYRIRWTVTETVNGSGDDFKHGDRHEVAAGVVTKEAASEEEIRAQLMEVLETSFPKRVMGGTYELERTYDISIERV